MNKNRVITFKIKGEGYKWKVWRGKREGRNVILLSTQT